MSRQYLIHVKKTEQASVDVSDVVVRRLRMLKLADSKTQIQALVEAADEAGASATPDGKLVLEIAGHAVEIDPREQTARADLRHQRTFEESVDKQVRAYDGGDRREVARQGAIAAETARLRKTLDARVETERAAALEDLSQAARAIDVGLARLLADAEQRVLRRNAERLGVLLSETRGVDPETGRQSTVFVVHLHDHPEA